MLVRLIDQLTLLWLLTEPIAATQTHVSCFRTASAHFGKTCCSLLGCWLSCVSAAQDHESTFQLLVSVILSAQTTDKKVNEVTPALFAVGKDAASMAALEARLPAACNLRRG